MTTAIKLSTLRRMMKALDRNYYISHMEAAFQDQSELDITEHNVLTLTENFHEIICCMKYWERTIFPGQASMIAPFEAEREQHKDNAIIEADKVRSEIDERISEINHAQQVHLDNIQRNYSQANQINYDLHIEGYKRAKAAYKAECAANELITDRRERELDRIIIDQRHRHAEWMVEYQRNLQGKLIQKNIELDIEQHEGLQDLNRQERELNKERERVRFTVGREWEADFYARFTPVVEKFFAEYYRLENADKAAKRKAKKNGPKIGLTYTFDLDLGGVGQECKALYLGKDTNLAHVFKYEDGTLMRTFDLESDIKNLQQVIV